MPARVLLPGLLLILSASPASALSITLSGPTVGPLTSGVGEEVASGGSITFTVGLTPETAINGYDLSVAWDPTELFLSSADQLFSGTGSPPGFLVSPVGGDSSGTRAAALIITVDTFANTELFSLTFDVLAVVDDGQADVSLFLDTLENGPGLSPGGLTIDNPSGAGIDVVPEPGTALLLAAGLLGLVVAGRRGRA